MNVEIDKSQFSLDIDDTPALRPCVALTLYLDATDKEGLLDFYNKGMAALGERLKYVLADSATTRSKITAKTQTMLPTWVEKPRQYKKYFIQFFEGETGASAAKLRMFFEAREGLTPEKIEMRRQNWRVLSQKPGGLGMGLSELFISFPLDHPLAQPGVLRTWLAGLKVMTGVGIVSGQVGLALNDYRESGASTFTDALEQRLSALVLQHPGLDWHANLTSNLLIWKPEADDLVPLMKRVNWLTLVGARAIEFLGGRERFTSNLGKDNLTLHPWGAVVQASEEPQIGNWGHRDFIPGYRRVAAALKPIRLPRIDGIGRGFSRQAAQEWLEAFDREY